MDALHCELEVPLPNTVGYEAPIFRQKLRSSLGEDASTQATDQHSVGANRGVCRPSDQLSRSARRWT